jgi:hypothetical protein
MHLHHHVQQHQQQMALNAAASVHHSHHDMDYPRIANLLLKNGNGFSQSSTGSTFGFYQLQHQQLPYNPQQQQQQQQYQQQQQQQAFPLPYLPDKLWNDHHSQTQYPLMHHQIMQQQAQTQASRSLFDTESHHHPQQQQQYHQPNLNDNTGVSLGVDLTNDLVGKSGIRGMAVKTKVANARVKL